MPIARPPLRRPRLLAPRQREWAAAWRAGREACEALAWMDVIVSMARTAEGTLAVTFQANDERTPIVLHLPVAAHGRVEVPQLLVWVLGAPDPTDDPSASARAVADLARACGLQLHVDPRSALVHLWHVRHRWAERLGGGRLEGVSARLRQAIPGRTAVTR